LENGKIYIDDDGDIMWHISPEDTENLEVTSYVYDIQLETGSGDVYTFLNGDFVLTDEVTLK